MPKLPFKAIAVVTILSIGALAMSQPAEARSRHRHNGGGAVAAAIAGLAIGAIIAGSASRRHRGYYGYEPYYAPPPPQRYYAPPPRVYYAPSPVVYGYALEPWSPEWYSYCARKFRSFDPHSGTYQPYHGPRRLCR